MSQLSAQDAKSIRDWNQHMRRPKVERTIHSLVKETTTRHPELPAVFAHDGELTYIQLDQASARLAQFLENAGVSAGSHVAICMSKSKLSIVAILAVLRAAAVVVPVGIQDPATRIETILRNTQVQTLLLDSVQAERLRGLQARMIVVDDALIHDLAGSPDEFERAMQPESAAWIIHTSGSTGTPKGVVLEHSGMSTLALAQAEELNAGIDTRRLQFAAFTFDVSIADIFTTLCSGGCVCVPSEDDRLYQLERFINASRVNFASITSTVAGLINPSQVPTLKMILMGGEAATSTTIRFWLGKAVLRIGYGPAECSVSSSHSPPVESESQGLYLGFPLTGCFWVADLDDYNKLCAVGQEGELLIESPTVARCYFNDPVKTANAFVTDPEFVAELGLPLGRRMYRTGDVVRQHRNGSITFVSRRDRQIKIRGQRVEIGEIESQLAPLLTDLRSLCVLQLKRDEDSLPPPLVAALEFNEQVARRHEGESCRALPLSDSLRTRLSAVRSSLLDTLPPYMVPSIYVPVNHLPVNASGKLDHNALAAVLLAMETKLLHSYSVLAPQSVLSSPDKGRADLCRIWCNLLALEEKDIGLEDDFFRLGGDSGLAHELARGALSKGLTLTTADVFRNPTFGDMLFTASHIESSLTILDQYEAFSVKVASGLRSSVKSSLKGRAADILPVTDFQKKVVADNLGPARSGFHYICLDSDGAPDMDMLETSLRQLIDEVECLRTAFFLDGDQLKQVVHTSYDPGYQSHTCLNSLEETATDVIANDKFHRPQLERPMVDIALLRFAEKKQHRILIRLTGATTDEDSCALICKTLESIYSGSIPKRYPPFSRYLVEWHGKTCTEDALLFWSEGLRDSRDTPLSALQLKALSTTSQRHSLSSGIYQCPGASWLSADMRGSLVKAAWALVLARLHGTTDVLFGDVLSTRRLISPDLSLAIGCCSVVLPFRVELQHTWLSLDLIHLTQELEDEMIFHACPNIGHVPTEGGSFLLPSELSSVVQHRDGKMVESVMLGETEYNVSIRQESSHSAVTVRSCSEDSHISITLDYDAMCVSAERAQFLLDLLLTSMKDLEEAPDRSLSSLLVGPLHESSSG